MQSPNLRRSDMDHAHFNRSELDELDNIQGYRESDPQTGMRSYSGLEQIIQNPHNLNSLLSMLQERVSQQSQQMGQPHTRNFYAGGMAPSAYADGGRVKDGHDYNNDYLNNMADMGRNGDNEVALIGPRSRMFFDHLALARGGCAVNPHTRKPEYFSLGGLFSGISNAFKPIASGFSNIMNTVAPIASQLAPMAGAAIGSEFGNPELGGMLGNVAGSLLGSGGGGQQQAPQGYPSQGTQAQPMSPYAQMGQQGINQFMQNRSAGQSLGQSAGNAMSGMARNVAGSMLNQYAPQIQQQAQGMMSRLPAPMQQPAMGLFNHNLNYAKQQFQNPYQQ